MKVQQRMRKREGEGEGETRERKKFRGKKMEHVKRRKEMLQQADHWKTKKKATKRMPTDPFRHVIAGKGRPCRTRFISPTGSAPAPRSPSSARSHALNASNWLPRGDAPLWQMNRTPTPSRPKIPASSSSMRPVTSMLSNVR